MTKVIPLHTPAQFMKKLDCQRHSFALSHKQNGSFRHVHIQVHVQNLPADFENYTIAHLTDFHLGPSTKLSHIARALEAAMSYKPNILVLTGDYIQLSAFGLEYFATARKSPKKLPWMDYKRTVRSHAHSLAALFQNIRPPDGVFATFGNHDYVEGAKLIARQFPDHVAWLKNCSHEVRKEGGILSFTGIDDLRRGQPNLKRAKSDYRSSSASPEDHFFRILLSHNPDITVTEQSSELSHFDLMICGHTHGGQIRFPFGGPVITQTRQRKHIRGLSQHDDLAVFTNAGVGYCAIPLRLFCPPEIGVIRLTRKEKYS